MVFIRSDGKVFEQRYSAYRADNPWKSLVPDNQSGTLQMYLRSGQMVSEYQISNGVWHGAAQLWDRKGHKLMEANYSMGKLDGMYRAWHYNRVKAREGRFSNGLEVGKHIAWYPTGALKNTCEYNSGMYNGLLQHWLQDGQIVANATYSNMWAINGTTIIEWVEGKPPVLGIYSNGLLLEKRKWRAQD